MIMCCVIPCAWYIYTSKRCRHVVQRGYCETLSSCVQRQLLESALEQRRRQDKEEHGR